MMEMGILSWPAAFPGRKELEISYSSAFAVAEYLTILTPKDQKTTNNLLRKWAYSRNPKYEYMLNVVWHMSCYFSEKTYK